MHLLRLIFFVATVFGIAGCGRPKQNEEQRQLSQAKVDFLMEMLEKQDSEKAAQLLSVKYDISIEDVRLIIDQTRTPNPFALVFGSGSFETVEEFDLHVNRARGDDLLATISVLTVTTGLSPQVIASMIIDYDSLTMADVIVRRLR